MKEIKISIIFIVIIVITISCGLNIKHHVDKASNNLTTNTKASINDYYKLIKNRENDYTLILYSKDKKILEKMDYPKEPSINLLEKNVIQITLSVGSPAHYVHYFNITSNKISDTYFNESFAGKGIIAYMSDGKLVIADLFNKGKIYKKIKRNFSPTANPSSAIIKMKLIRKNKFLIKYLTGHNYTEKTETVKFR